MDSTWLTAKEAAAYMRKHPDTVRTLMRRHDLRAIKRGKTWLTRTDWCDNYITGEPHAA